MITWNITCCYTVDKVSGHEDLGRIISSADFTVSDDIGVFYQGNVAIPTSNLNNFMAYESVTEADVIQWVHSVLGDQKIIIENKAAGRGLPWSK